MDSDSNNIINTYISEIEGYLKNKRILYEAEGRREFVPLIDRTVQMIRSIKDPVVTDTPINTAEQSNSRSSSQLIFDRPSEKMYQYAEGEAIDCAICIEHVEEKHAQVRLSCGHIYHLNCLGSHFNHSGDFKCPYCRLEIERYVKQPRPWEHPPNGPPTPQNLNESNDIPHPGELDFANFQRGVLQVVNSIFGGRLNLGHPFRNDNGAEEEFFDNDDDDVSDSDQVIYSHFDGVTGSVNNSDSDSDDESNSSDYDADYNQSESVSRFRTQHNPYYSDSNENLPAPIRRARLVMHASNIRPDESLTGHDGERNNQDRRQENRIPRSSLHEHNRQGSSTRSRSSSQSRHRSDSLSSMRVNYHGYSERELVDIGSQNSNNNSSTREIDMIGSSSRRYEDRNNDDPSFIGHTAQILYDHASDNFGRPRRPFHYNFNQNDETFRNDEQYNQNSQDSLHPNIRSEERFYNTLPQTILNASQPNHRISVPYCSTSDSEFEFSNALYRHATTSSRLRNMYQEESTAEEALDDTDESSSSSTESEHTYDEDDDQDDDEVMFTGTFNWDAGNGMETSDDDTEDEGYRRCFTRRSSSSSDSHNTFSSSDEEDEDNASINTTTTSQSSPNRHELNQHWYKPWSWYNSHLPSTNSSSDPNGSTIAAVDSDATISSGDEFDFHA